MFKLILISLCSCVLLCMHVQGPNADRFFLSTEDKLDCLGTYFNFGVSEMYVACCDCKKSVCH